jgi:hypothetical protein
MVTRRGRASRRAAVGVMATALSLVVADIVVAHHDSDIRTIFPTLNTAGVCHIGRVCQTDNATLTYYYGQGMSGTAAHNTDVTLYDTYNTTDLNVVKHTTAVTAKDQAETDIMYRIAPDEVPDSKIGVTRCASLGGPSIECDRFIVAFEKTPNVHLACHETGHAVGLVHGDNAFEPVSKTAPVLGCMGTGVSDRYLRAHNAWWINVIY